MSETTKVWNPDTKKWEDTPNASPAKPAKPTKKTAAKKTAAKKVAPAPKKPPAKKKAKKVASTEPVHPFGTCVPMGVCVCEKEK